MPVAEGVEADEAGIGLVARAHGPVARRHELAWVRRAWVARTRCLSRPEIVVGVKGILFPAADDRGHLRELRHLPCPAEPGRDADRNSRQNGPLPDSGEGGAEYVRGTGDHVQRAARLEPLDTGQPGR